jgi:hypothetical protein
MAPSDIQKLQQAINDIREVKAMLKNSRGFNTSGGGFSPTPGGRGSTQRDSRDLRFCFPVKLTQTGGSAGTSSAQCSFTYTVKDLTGVQTLGTSIGITGNGNRIANMTMTAGTYGMAYYQLDGTLTLLFADEKASQTNCT